MFSTDVIRSILINDVTDVSPSLFLLPAPTGQSRTQLTTTHLFSASGDVPEYLYKSLKTLWIGSAAASGAWRDQVVSHKGQYGDSPKGGIVITLDKFYPAYSPNIPHQVKPDDNQSMTALVTVTLYKPRVNMPGDTVENSATRIMMLLDQYLRQQLRYKPSQITVDGDTSIHPDNFQCFLLEGSGPAGVSATDRTMELLFRVAFKKIII